MSADFTRFTRRRTGLPPASFGRLKPGRYVRTYCSAKER